METKNNTSEKPFEGLTVTRTISTKETNESNAISMEVTLNFSNVANLDFIVKHAAKSLFILAQAKWRAHGEKWMVEHKTLTIDVADYFSGREKQTKLEKAQKQTSQLDLDEKRKLLEQLKAELVGK